jgi:hypothetical protein
MGKMFEIEADSNYSGWNRAKILVIGFSLFLPGFFSSPFCHLFPTIRWVGGLLAGCWLANRNSLGASVLGVCSLKDEPQQQRMISFSMFRQFTSKKSRWRDVMHKGLQMHKFKSE